MRIRSKEVVIIIFAVGAIIIFAIYCSSTSKKLVEIYNSRRSVIMSDRNHQIISIKTNEDGSAAIYTENVPENFSKYILGQEDKYFYYHFGINPVSSLRAFTRILNGNKNRASSTITQQLVKILMNNEDDRSIKNKLIETFGAIALEMTTSKKDILTMYANSIYFGNNVQGIEAASKLYFGKNAGELTEQNIIRLVVTIQNPTAANPFTELNTAKSRAVIKNYNLQSEEIETLTTEEIRAKIEAWRSIVQSTTAFEIKSLGITCSSDCTLTIDSKLTENLRNVLLRNLLQFQDKQVDNGAIVVIKEPENELLAIVGSPDPTKNTSGYQINMANSPRPIGSTVKPFIYLKAFEKGLRPYTLADDREYRYPIGTGFPLYPKNYDYAYHGIVTLHEALSNSYNVPAVKTLEYIGTDNFANFLRTDLNFKPVQPLENYALGIALGELEMPLLNLSYYLSIFANHGFLKPLQVKNSSVISRKLQLTRNPQSVGEDPSPTLRLGRDDNTSDKQIAPEPYIQLVNKILADRTTGVEQFGLKSVLNLPASNYALKTGTSREYHDSWTVGYTPNFLVGVWVGNSDNTPMDGVSGQSGAGNIWGETMNIMYTSRYNHNTPFDFKYVKTFQNGNSLEYGLSNDDYNLMRNKLITNSLVTNPHNGDVFLLDNKTTIPLKSSQIASWYVNDEFVGKNTEILFQPKKPGQYTIRAVGDDEKEESVTIGINK